MKLVFGSADIAGALLPSLKLRAVELRDTKEGKVAQVTLEQLGSEATPRVEAFLFMVEAEAKEFRDSLDKLFPRLASVKGSKS